MFDIKAYAPTDSVFFYDRIPDGTPYVSLRPRDHESLFVVTKGRMSYTDSVTGAERVIAEGEVGYIARGSLDTSAAYQCPYVAYIATNFCIDREHAIPERTLPFDTVCSSGIGHQYEALFVAALNEFESSSPGKCAVCNGLLLQIIGSLYSEQNTDVSILEKSKRIERSVKYLQENYFRPDFSCGRLAELSHMSEKQFRRLFFDVYGKNPYAYLQDYRLSKAEILLLNTPKSISVISQQCGFADVYSFSHCFKTHYGVSPKAFRDRTL